MTTCVWSLVNVGYSHRRNRCWVSVVLIGECFVRLSWHCICSCTKCIQCTFFHEVRFPYLSGASQTSCALLVKVFRVKPGSSSYDLTH